MRSLHRVGRPTSLFLIFSVVAAGQSGVWEPSFNHPTGGVSGWPATFNAVHVALIPVGPDRGKVLAFDFDATQNGLATWTQRWSIVDTGPMAPSPARPTAAAVVNAVLPMPAGGGDFFCAGHSWTADGRLFVAGGTTQYAAGTLPYMGGYLAYLFDPQTSGNAAWTRLPDLALGRWYPSVTLSPNGDLLVSGGTFVNGGVPHNNYEVWDAASEQWKLGSGGARTFVGPAYGSLGAYPRLFQLTTGDLFRAGQSQWTARMNPSGVWTTMAQSVSYRTYGSAVLVPWAQDRVWILGGYDPSGASLSSVQQVDAAAPTSATWGWSYAPAMVYARSRHNATLLPDGSVFVVGGRSSPNSQNPPTFVLQPEIMTKDGSWTVQPPHFSPREYHSTSVLLPDGRVLVGGGNTRTRDWEVFRPPYLTSGAPRPTIDAVPEKIAYGAAFDVATGTKTSAVSVVLMRPASLTHHSDFDQRYVELPVVDAGDGILTATAPAGPTFALPGWYMVFVRSETGTPSVAAWTYLS